MAAMDMKRFSKVNRQRCVEDFEHDLGDWSHAEWTNAMAGEAGEACNKTKKLLRHRDGIAGNTKPEDRDEATLRRAAAREIADTIIYADLAIQALGFDTSEVLRETFNAKSDELGSSFRV